MMLKLCKRLQSSCFDEEEEEDEDEDEHDDYDDSRGIWENDIDYLPNTGQISEVVNSVLKFPFNVYTYCVSNKLFIYVLDSFLCNIKFLPVARKK